MEVQVESEGCDLPEGSYISVRVGDLQKQTLYDPKKVYRFPEVRRFGKVDLYQRVGTCEIVWAADEPETRSCRIVGLAGDTGTRIKVHMSRPVTTPAPTGKVGVEGAGARPGTDPEQPSKAKEANMQAKKYLAQHDIEGIFTGTMRALLKNMPEDAPSFICEHIAKRFDLQDVKATQQADTQVAVEQVAEVPAASLPQPPPAAPSTTGAAVGTAVEETENETGAVVFQRGKKLNDEHFIISVQASAEKAVLNFSAYELESSETFEMALSYAVFDALFQDVSDPALLEPANMEGRYDWVVDRLQLTTDSGGVQRLSLPRAGASSVQQQAFATLAAALESGHLEQAVQDVAGEPSAAAEAAEANEEESGTVVFQRGRKMNDEHYVMSVHANEEGKMLKFSAYELESSDTFEVSLSYADFDALFNNASDPELVNPANMESRYDWVVERLDLTTDCGGMQRLNLPQASQTSPSAPSQDATDLREEVAQVMLSSVEDGSLQTALANLTDVNKTTTLRQQAREAFIAASANGSLQQALVEVTQACAPSGQPTPAVQEASSAAPVEEDDAAMESAALKIQSIRRGQVARASVTEVAASKAAASSTSASSAQNATPADVVAEGTAQKTSEEAAGGIDLAALRSQVSTQLIKAGRDGSLEQALKAPENEVAANMVAASAAADNGAAAAAATSGADATATDNAVLSVAAASGAAAASVDLQATRNNAFDVLLKADQDGGLEAVLEVTGSAAMDLEAVRCQTREAFIKANQDGSLEKALTLTGIKAIAAEAPLCPNTDAVVKAGQEGSLDKAVNVMAVQGSIDLEQIRGQVSAALLEANSSGALEKALQPAPLQALQPAPLQADDKKLRTEAYDVLVAALGEGTLEATLNET